MEKPGGKKKQRHVHPYKIHNKRTVGADRGPVNFPYDTNWACDITHWPYGSKEPNCYNETPKEKKLRERMIESQKGNEIQRER